MINYFLQRKKDIYETLLHSQTRLSETPQYLVFALELSKQKYLDDTKNSGVDLTDFLISKH